MLELLATALLAYVAIAVAVTVTLSTVSIFTSPSSDYHIDPTGAATVGAFWPTFVVAVVCDVAGAARRLVEDRWFL